MIVWGGTGAEVLRLDTGGVYDLETDCWCPTTTTGAPTPRQGHTAVWTGSRMIVWGGDDGSSNVNTGALYDPAKDSWRPLSTTEAPSPRSGHVAVWTGSRMIVWGGAGESADTSITGGIYDPAKDSWTQTSTAGVPTDVSGAAVWTGARMIVWGGMQQGINPPGRGAIYDNPALLARSSYTVPPCRVVDTRRAPGPSGGPMLAGNSTRSFKVAGACGIPSTAVAVSVTVTAVGAAAPGYLTLFPGDHDVAPLASSVNFATGLTRANNAIVPLATDGSSTIEVKNASAGAVHFVLDVNGYFQ
jgi:hypothetical protein